MAREAREEVGVRLSPADLELVGVMHRRCEDERVDFFLAARTWSGQIRNVEPDRCNIWLDSVGFEDAAG